MGTDKGLLPVHTTTWVQQAAAIMTALPLPFVVSVNESQYDQYNTLFAPEQLGKDNTALRLKGPLLGVLSVHAQQSLQDILVLACDMPLMDIVIPRQLISLYEKGTADAYVFTNDGEPEPLCAIYTAKGLAHIMQLYNNNQLTRYSMKFMLEQLTVQQQPVLPEQKKYFQNFNAHAQLNGL
jgi:molybdopterin-guanine dinucleotide biosynthesis protein A